TSAAPLPTARVGMAGAWRLQGMALTTKVCEVKKPGGGRPHGKVLALACGATGRCVWSVGQTAVMLWDALTGQYLGSLRSSGGDGPYGLDSGTGLMWIDPAQLPAAPS
ncbi:Fe2OG dioxygenase domain-containing protein, partial [Haematococcus lacustris]